MNNKDLTIGNNYSPALVKLGLTPDEARCYSLLVNRGAASPKAIAGEINVLPNAVYRLLIRLKEKGFVIELDTYPASFQAIPPGIAIDSFTKNKVRQLEESSSRSIQELTKSFQLNPTKIDFVIGRAAMFAKAVELLRNAKEEILIESIGEPVPDEIKMAQVEAVKKGIKVKFIVHKNDPGNKDLLESWVRMGLELRYYPASGYHLNIIDSKNCLLAASNPDNPSERISVIIYSKELTKAMRDFFFNTWEKAVPVQFK